MWYDLSTMLLSTAYQQQQQQQQQVKNFNNNTTNGPKKRKSEERERERDRERERERARGERTEREHKPEVKEETVEEDGLYYGELENDHMEYNEVRTHKHTHKAHNTYTQL